MTKPFGIGELMARIRAFLRTAALSGEEGPVYDDGTLCIDLARREVRLRGRRWRSRARSSRCWPCWRASPGVS